MSLPNLRKNISQSSKYKIVSKTDYFNDIWLITSVDIWNYFAQTKKNSVAAFLKSLSSISSSSTSN